METVKEKLKKLIDQIDIEEYMNISCHKEEGCDLCQYNGNGCLSAMISDYLIQNGVTIAGPARPLEEWHEDYGDVLWWTFPIAEPPYVGSPLCSDWPGYHTHWTPLPPYPQPTKGVQ